jgi:hypothetical protein
MGLDFTLTQFLVVIVVASRRCHRKAVSLWGKIEDGCMFYDAHCGVPTG